MTSVADEAAPSGVRVSVVIPVYNTGDYLLPGLQSLADQDLPQEEFEVVAVDDGSTDGSGEILDEWAATHPNVRVVHQSNSGWPGQPRNLGTDLSVGRYVFYMDADDLMAAYALREMTDYADQHDSDVLVIKTQGLNGRYSSNRPWLRTRADSDLFEVFLTLAPQKLFRRSFIVGEGLRFPEEKVRLEDGMFLSEAYLRARRVSTLADDVYYFLTRREGGANISAAMLDPVGYTQSIRVISRTVRELCHDPDLADRIVLDLYRRKALKVFAPDRFLGYTRWRRRAWVEAVSRLADDLVPVSLEEQLGEPFRTRSRLARAGEVQPMVRMCREQSATGPVIPATRGRRLLNRVSVRGPMRIATNPLVWLYVRGLGAHRTPDGLVLLGRARLRGRSPVRLTLQVALVLRGSEDREPTCVEAVAGPLDRRGAQTWHALLDRRHLAKLPQGTYDVVVRDDRGELQGPLEANGMSLPPPVRFPRRGRVLTAYVAGSGALRLKVARLDSDEA